jgi:GTPase
MIVVALDGPSGSGKSSTSKNIAIRAGWNYLDTGALYRAVTYIALSIKSENPDDIIAAVIDSPITFNSNPRDPQVFVGAINVSEEIRSSEVTEKVSIISALPQIRAEFSLSSVRLFQKPIAESWLKEEILVLSCVRKLH